MDLFNEIEKIYASGFRQKTERDCGPASVELVAKAYGVKRVHFETLLSYPKYGRWLNRQAGRVRGIILTELHFATEAAFGKKFEVVMTRAFPENFNKFVADLKLAKAGQLAIVLNFNQDFLLGRPYKNDETAFTHYSPVIGYNGKRVVIADVDKELREPYSVPMKHVFNSMAEDHHIFGYPRGWITIRQRSNK